MSAGAVGCHGAVGAGAGAGDGDGDGGAVGDGVITGWQIKSAIVSHFCGIK